MNLTIKHKLLLVAAVAVLGFIAVGLMMVSSSQSNQQWILAEKTLIELKSTALMLRRHEKDFLARKELRYGEKFDTDLALAEDQLRLIRKTLADSTDINDNTLQDMAGYLNSYATKFRAIMKAQEDIGLDPKSGLYGELRGSVHEVKALLTDSATIKSSMLMLRRHEKDFMLRRDSKYVDKFVTEIDLFKSLVNEQLEPALAQQVNDSISSYADSFNTLVDSEVNIGLSSSDGVKGEMRAAVHNMETLFTELQKSVRHSIEEHLNQGQTMLFIGITIACLVVVIINILIGRSIYQPLAAFKNSFVEIADTRNIGIRLNRNNHDELGEMGSAFDRMLDMLHDMMEEIKQSSEQVVQSANVLSSSSVTLRDSSDAQHQEIEQASAAVTEMTGTTQEIARNASEAATTVTQTLDEVIVGTDAGNTAKREIQTLTEEVQEAVHAIKELEENSKNIETVLDTIQGIAEQTNLLALNAAIEAARAGEQGRGFAVVADEVRTLAQRTQESTVTIRNTISTFQVGTAEVVAKVTKSNERAESGIELVSQSAAILGNINDMMLRVNDMNTQIAAAAEEQSHAAEEINRSVIRVNDISYTLAEQSQLASTSSDQLLQQGQKLNQVVNEFNY